MSDQPISPAELAEWKRIDDAQCIESCCGEFPCEPCRTRDHVRANNFRRLIDEVERLTEERDYYKDGYWLQDKQLNDVEQACIEAGIQTTDSMGMTDVWAEFVREIVRQRDESRAEVERLRADYADAIKRNGDLAVRAGHAEGMLVGIGYHGDVKQMVENFWAENERLRRENDRLRAGME